MNIFNKFHKDRTTIVDFLSIAKFLNCYFFLLTLEEKLSLWYLLILVFSEKLYFLTLFPIFAVSLENLSDN